MSGGIDSSMSAYILQQQGYEVIGVSFVMYKPKHQQQYFTDAKKIADLLNIKHYIKDISADFNEKIITYFIAEYLQARTPNPCVICNALIKWKYLYLLSKELECKYIATGHYAIVNQLNNRYYLSRAKDISKDQTFFLWNLPQEYLCRTILPLGNYLKEDIKRMAENLKFNFVKDKKESYGVCFLGNENYRKFIEQNISETTELKKRGEFLTAQNKYLGKHNGFYFYTIGQKVMIEKTKFYVTKFNTADNSIILGTTEDLYVNTLIINNLNLLKYENILSINNINAVTLYRDGGVECEIKKEDENYKIFLKDKIRIPAPGQSLCFYQDQDLIGGAIINKVVT